MRVVTLLPSATDIVAALGAGENIVGVSHSCSDEWKHLPALTSTIVDYGAPSADIDDQVTQADAPLYDLDIETLEALRPDVVISQSLCDVCAVASGDVEEAVKTISSRPALINLSPFGLSDVPQGFLDVGAAIGHEAEAAALTESWTRRLSDIQGKYQTRPPVRIAFLDWLDPPFAAGHWIPDMITLIGGTSVLAKSGEPSREITWDDVRDAKPDIVIAACCGFETGRAGQDKIPDDIDVHLLDGQDYFSRPGPRLLDSIDMLAAKIDALTGWEKT